MQKRFLGVLCCAGMAAAAPVKIFEDDFSSAHTYWNGTSAALAGGWRGVLHQTNSSMIDAGVSVPGCLSIHIPAGTRGDAENTQFTAPALYLSVTGNFTAIAQLREPMPTEFYDNYGIMVFNPDGSINHATLHAFPVLRTWASNVVLRITQNGSSANAATRIPAMPWLKLERNGNTFTASCKAQESDPWLLVGNGSAAFLPASVNVGPFAANYSAADDDVYSFERFEVWQDQNPALTLLPDLYRTHLFYGQTGTFTATLRNDGIDPAAWNAAGLPAWLSIAPSNGALAAGAATSVVFQMTAAGMSSPALHSATIMFNNPGVVPHADILMSTGPETNAVTLFQSGFETADGYNAGSVYSVPGWRNWGATNQAFVVAEAPASGAQALKVYYTGARTYYTPGPECVFPLLTDGVRSGRIIFQCKLRVEGPQTLTVYPNLAGAAPAAMPGCLKLQSGSVGAMAALMFGNQTNTDLEATIPVPGGVTRGEYHDVSFQYSMPDQRINWAAIDTTTQAWSDLTFLRGVFKGASPTNMIAWLGFAVGHYFPSTAFWNYIYVDDVNVTWLTDKYPSLNVTPGAVAAWMEREHTTTVVVRLENAGDLGTAWQCAAPTNGWLSLPATNGYLAPGAATTLTATVHAVQRGVLEETLVFHSAAETPVSTRVIAYVVSPALLGEILDDHFDQPHTYCLNSVTSVTGTPWSGVLHAESATQIVAHSVWESHLVVQPYEGMYCGLEDMQDNAPALYRAVTGSFDATILLGAYLPAVQWECPGLLAYDPQNALPNYVFVSAFAINNRMLTRSTESGSSQAFVVDGVHHWVRMLRDEEMFWMFSRATNQTAWRILSVFERQDMPEVLYVGPMNAPFNANGSEYYYDRCTIMQREIIPEPVVLMAAVALLALLGRGRSQELS